MASLDPSDIASALLTREALHQGLDDWVSVAHLGDPRDAASLEVVIGVAGDLVRKGLVRFGRIDRDAGWQYYDDDPDVVLANLRQVFVDRGPSFSNFYLWLELTPAGKTLAQSLEPEWEQRAESDAHRTSAST